MHVPDGYLDLWIAATFLVASAAVLTWSYRKLDGGLPENRIPVLGVVAAAVFAAQLLDWPIPGGTSAHFVGGAFAAILLGPYLGSLAMAAVVVIQAVVFGDGGLLALGANLWNMAIVDVFVAYGLYSLLVDYDETVAVFVAGWGAVTIAAFSLGLQIGFSSLFGYDVGLTVMIMTVGHALLGLIEGAITVTVYRYVQKMRPDLVAKRPVTHVEGAA